jgi:tetratricopeptide (TPR) repeat protein
MGYESYLDYFLHKRDVAKAAGSEDSFRISPEECELLRDEALIYYYRYDLLYMKKDYERAIRDTARNLQLFDFIARYAEHLEDRESMEMYRPFALRVHIASRALLSAKRGRFDEALRQVRLGLTRLDELAPLDDPKWRRERKSAAAFLRRLERRLERSRPLTQRQRLQRELKKAVDREDYESAAKLRDRLASLPDNSGSDGSAPQQTSN